MRAMETTAPLPHGAYSPTLQQQALVDRFQPITLAGMAEVALQDRQEIKFVFNTHVLETLLADLVDDYCILSVGDCRVNRYRTLYFDTSNLDLYRRHQAGVQERYKVRSREYVESQSSFLEVKHRTNRKRTIKNRIATETLVTKLDAEYADFVESNSPLATDSLHPVLWNGYSRITLVSCRHSERITLDIGLHFEDALAAYIDAALPGIVIAEVKQPHSTRSSPFIARLRELQVRPSSFSKYCMGITLLHPAVQQNRFKRTHRLLAKWQQGEAWTGRNNATRLDGRVENVNH